MLLKKPIVIALIVMLVEFLFALVGILAFNLSGFSWIIALMTPFLVGYFYTYKFKENIEKNSKIKAIIYILIFQLLIGINGIREVLNLANVGIVIVFLVFAFLLYGAIIYVQFDFGSKMMLRFLKKIKENKKKKSKRS